MNNSPTVISLSDYEGKTLAKAYETPELSKAGEGSRGGQVVGRTKSGKPIYGNIGDHRKYARSYTHEDHEDAASYHRGKQKSYSEGQHGMDIGEAAKRDRVVHHKTNADYHDIEGYRKKQALPKESSSAHSVAEGHRKRIEAQNAKMPDAIRNVMNKATDDAYTLLGLEKAGEGSRGGKVIGHTKTGKAVYEHHGAFDYDDQFTPQDHYDAARLHSINSISPRDKHDKAANAHVERGVYKEKLAEHHGHYAKMSDAEKKKYRSQVRTTHDVGTAMGVETAVASGRFAAHKAFLEQTKGGKLSKAAEAYALLGLEAIEKAGEGSHGGKVIGHTRSGKPIYDSEHENYTERKKFPKYNGEVSTSMAVSHGSSHAKHYFASKHQGWSKEDHADAADAHRAASKEHRQKWGEKQKEAHQHTFKKDPEFTDYKVSGIGRSEYSEEHKDALRHHARKETAHLDAARAHEKLAGGKQHYAKGSEVRKAEDAYELLGVKLEKAGGEGSRGGHIIGHTHTGKPIYDKFEHEGHRDFTSNDHQGAAKFHIDQAHQRYFEGRYGEQAKHLDEARKHQLEGFSRHVDSFNEVYNNPKVKVLTISDKNPLSTQLSKLTGDSWNSTDFEGGAGIGNVFRHTKTGQQFTAINEREKEILKKYKR